MKLETIEKTIPCLILIIVLSSCSIYQSKSSQEKSRACLAFSINHGMNKREEILSLLNGQRPAQIPCFSGLIQITAAGLDSVGLKLHEAHTDAGKMARAAASTFKLTGFPSAVVPLDLCVEAEALGAKIDFHIDLATLYFQTPEKPFSSKTVRRLIHKTPAGDVFRWCAKQSNY